MRGWLALGRPLGVSIRVHWSTPLGAILFGGLGFRPGFWLAFFVVVLVHEIGHAVVVRATGHEVLGVDVHGAGGVCHWDGSGTRLHHALIAWGGVWGQLLLATGAFVFMMFSPPASAIGADLMAGLTKWNLFLAAFNLLPIPPFDGAEAWKLPGLLRERWRARKKRRDYVIAQKRSAPRPLPKKRAASPWDDEAPPNDEARKVIDFAKEVAKRAAKDQTKN